MSQQSKKTTRRDRSTYEIDVQDNLLGQRVRITRRVEEGQGYHNFGSFSYRGERLTLVMGGGVGIDGHVFTSQEYPPPLRKCKTQRAKDFYKPTPTL